MSINTFKKRKLPSSNVLIILWLAAILLTACSAARAPVPMEQEALYPGAPVSEEMAGERATSDLAGASLPEPTERLVIKNADLTIVVDDPSVSLDNIVRLAEEMGGFVVSANLYHSRLESGAEVPRAAITIRIPAERLDEALAQIEAESDRLPLNKNINSQDVTGDYTDLQSRLLNLEEAEAQLREIMASANKTEDVLAVYNELVQVREQIEVIKGQIQFYEQSAALSAISVDILANEAVQPLTIGGWQPVGVAKGAIQALINALKFIAIAIIWIALFLLPVLLVLAMVVFLPLYLLWRLIRRRRDQRKSDITPAQPKEPSASQE